jgi:hypothetical protein
MWRLLYSNWRPAKIEQEGYSILLMFPGDLPVFLNLALEVCAAQNPQHLVEVLVIPDKMHDVYERKWESIRSRWPHSPIRLVKLGPLEQWYANHRNSPFHNCWLQMIRGLEQVRSTYAL